MTTLDVPYLSQLDNQFNPTGSCNVTSIAMCLMFFGIQGDRSYAQLEDQLYQRCEANQWSRHDPFDLQKLAQSYPGMRDDLTTTGTMADIYAAIDAGQPCILHGYFTRFGHIIVVIGYDEEGLICHDPYGEWFCWGYDTNKSGKAIHYSNDLIAETCSPESFSQPNHIWLHRISRVEL